MASALGKGVKLCGTFTAAEQLEGFHVREILATKYAFQALCPALAHLRTAGSKILVLLQLWVACSRPTPTLSLGALVIRRSRHWSSKSTTSAFNSTLIAEYSGYHFRDRLDRTFGFHSIDRMLFLANGPSPRIVGWKTTGFTRLMRYSVGSYAIFCNAMLARRSSFRGDPLHIGGLCSLLCCPHYKSSIWAHARRPSFILATYHFLSAFFLEASFSASGFKNLTCMQDPPGGDECSSSIFFFSH